METRRLLRLIASAISVVLLVQYFELPYRYVLPNLVPFGKLQEASDGSIAVMGASTTQNWAKEAFSSGSNSYRMEIDREVLNIEEFSDGKGADGKHDFKSDIDQRSNDPLIVGRNPGDKSPSWDLAEISSNSTNESVEGKVILAPEKARENGDNLPVLNCSSGSNSSLDDLRLRSDVPASDRNEEKIFKTTTSPVSSLPVESPHHVTPQQRKVSNRRTSAVSSKINKSTLTEYQKPGVMESNLLSDTWFGVMESNLLSDTVNHSSKTSTPIKKRRFKRPPAVVVPISAMNTMLLQSRFTQKLMKPKLASQVDEELLNVKAVIEKAEIIEEDPHLDAHVFRNFSTFFRSYELMEQTLKVYIYSEGERPVFHQQELTGIYASEGWFMKQLEENKQFVTKNPNKAHLFYLPFSSRLLEETLYVPNSHSRKNLVQYLSNYLKTITTKYRFWDRTNGADHFLVACHDWAPSETSRIMKNCIRSLCNADARGGFQFGKDVSLPETFVHLSENPLETCGGKPPSQRKILAFFAGKVHGYLRPILLNHWGNKDPDMKIFGKLPHNKGQMDYAEYMKSSKYCISAKGYEGNTPRVVEAILYECVPVIIADNYVPPFFETLNWESFAIFVLEKDIPNLKNILLSIPENRYLEMHQRVKRVQKHFLWHSTPIKYDVFHMILHSIWYTRVFQMRP